MNTQPDPANMSRRALVWHTRNYHALSTLNTDNPRSNYHRFFYRCAMELEKRGLNLTTILRRKNAHR